VDFTDRHRAEMDKIATLAELDALLSRSNLLANFVAYAERNGVAKDEAGLALSREVIEAQLRAYIGRNALHDDAGFYYNIYPIDKTMQSAVKELRTRLNKSNNKR
jgi:carboxyl-terminal processing protease